MSDHERFQILADHPGLLADKTPQQLLAFAEHLEQCEYCMRAHLAALEFEEQVRVVLPSESIHNP